MEKIKTKQIIKNSLTYWNNEFINVEEEILFNEMLIKMLKEVKSEPNNNNSKYWLETTKEVLIYNIKNLKGDNKKW